MAGPAHPHAMAPPKAGRTRTAPPQMPSTWWSSSRMRTYLLFDATGILYFLVAFVAIRMIRALSDGPVAWAQAMKGPHGSSSAAGSSQRCGPTLFKGVTCGAQR